MTDYDVRLEGKAADSKVWVGRRENKVVSRSRNDWKVFNTIIQKARNEAMKVGVTCVVRLHDPVKPELRSRHEVTPEAAREYFRGINQIISDAGFGIPYPAAEGGTS